MRAEIQQARLKFRQLLHDTFGQVFNTGAVLTGEAEMCIQLVDVTEAAEDIMVLGDTIASVQGAFSLVAGFCINLEGH